MKIGDLIVCINPVIKGNDALIAKPLVKDKIYSVRDIVKHQVSLGVRLEEIVNNIHPVTKVEICYRADRFVPVQDTPSIEHIMEKLNEPEPTWAETFYDEIFGDIGT